MVFFYIVCGRHKEPISEVNVPTISISFCALFELSTILIRKSEYIMFRSVYYVRSIYNTAGFYRLVRIIFFLFNEISTAIIITIVLNSEKYQKNNNHKSRQRK